MVDGRERRKGLERGWTLSRAVAQAQGGRNEGQKETTGKVIWSISISHKVKKVLN